jgi:hypothetical protein
MGFNSGFKGLILVRYIVYGSKEETQNIFFCQGNLMGAPFNRKIIYVIDVSLGAKSCFMLMMTCFFYVSLHICDLNKEYNLIFRSVAY